MSVSAGLFGGSAEEWDAFLLRHPAATFSHHHAWLQLVQETYGGTPYCLAACDGEEIVGILPLVHRWAIGAGRIMVSVPFADEGGVCADTVEAEDALLDHAYGLARETKVAYIELRQRHAVARELPCDRSRVTLVKALPQSTDQLWQGLNGKTRNHVRKAQRCGLETQDGGAELLPAFYDIYAHNMRDLGSPMHAATFLRGVLQHFPGQTRVVMVVKDQKPIGGGIAIISRQTMAVPWASSLRAHFSLRPNHLLYWRLMELGVAAKCERLDFGRSPRNSGTYAFKAQWGAEEVQLNYQILPVSRVPSLGERRESAGYRTFSWLWRRTPVPVARALGPAIFARLPL